MTTVIDPLEVIASDLRERQLAVIRDRARAVYDDGYISRMAESTKNSIGSLHRMLRASGINSDRIEGYLLFIGEDPRFGFLNVIPSVAVLTVARSRALEQGLFGTITDASTEMGLLLSLYTILLDGLMDETPEVIAADSEVLTAVMLGQEWAVTGAPPVFPSRPDRHPLATLLCQVTSEFIRRVVTSDGWRRDLEVRRRFVAASRAAFLAEVESVPLTIVGSPPHERLAISRALRAKSVHCSVVTALAPVCLRGSPSGLDLEAYEAFARAVGAYSGWIDDIADVLLDLRQGRWSNVLLHVLEATPRSPGTDLRTAMAYRVTDERLAERLAATGAALYENVLTHLELLPLSPEPLLAVLADITRSALESERI